MILHSIIFNSLNKHLENSSFADSQAWNTPYRLNTETAMNCPLDAKRVIQSTLSETSAATITLCWEPLYHPEQLGRALFQARPDRLSAWGSHSAYNLGRSFPFFPITCFPITPLLWLISILLLLHLFFFWGDGGQVDFQLKPWCH